MQPETGKLFTATVFSAESFEHLKYLLHCGEFFRRYLGAGVTIGNRRNTTNFLRDQFKKVAIAADVVDFKSCFGKQCFVVIN